MHISLLHIFDLSDISSDKLKIDRITAMFKDGKNYQLGKLQAYVCVTMLFKILKKIMLNRLCKYNLQKSTRLQHCTIR